MLWSYDCHSSPSLNLARSNPLDCTIDLSFHPLQRLVHLHKLLALPLTGSLLGLRQLHVQLVVPSISPAELGGHVDRLAPGGGNGRTRRAGVGGWRGTVGLTATGSAVGLMTGAGALDALILAAGSHGAKGGGLRLESRDGAGLGSVDARSLTWDSAVLSATCILGLALQGLGRGRNAGKFLMDRMVILEIRSVDRG